MRNERKKTMAEFITGLRKLAVILETADLPTMAARTFYCSVGDKEELLQCIRALGGVWDKSLSYGGDDIHLTSRELPIMLSIPRDKVCRKKVTYDCEPMFSPDDEKELDAAALGVSA